MRLTAYLLALLIAWSQMLGPGMAYAQNNAGPFNAPVGPGGAGNFTSLTATNLTNGRFALVGTGGLITDSANFTYSGAQMLMATGSAGNPTLALGQTSAGWWGTGSNEIRASIAGADKLRLNASSLRPEANAGLTLGVANVGFGGLYIDYTNTGTVGAVTINKAAGRVNIAASGTSVVVTNSVVTAAAHVFCNVAAVDTTAKTCQVTPGSGTMTITLGSAATAQVPIDFFVVSAD